jgi:hypothetical protein
MVLNNKKRLGMYQNGPWSGGSCLASKAQLQSGMLF